MAGCSGLMAWGEKLQSSSHPKAKSTTREAEHLDLNPSLATHYLDVLSRSVMSNSLWPPGLCSPPGSSVHEDSPGKNTGVSCHALLQGIFPTQGLNPGLLHCKWILYRLSHQGCPHYLDKFKQISETAWASLLHLQDGTNHRLAL